MISWTRPSHLSAPRVWRRLPGIRIEDLPPERAEEAVDHITKYFLQDEPCGRAVGVHEDDVSLKDLSNAFRKSIPCGVSLIAVDEKTGEMAGVNFLQVKCRSDGYAEKEFEEATTTFKGVASKKIYSMLNELDSKVNIFDHFGVDSYLDSLGLSVSPNYRKRGLGQEITWARLDMAKQFGLPVTKAIVTSLFSKKIALKVGLELLVEIPYSDYKDADGNHVFATVASPHTHIAIMAARVPKVIALPPPIVD